MPFYKLVCSDCGHAFEKNASVRERTEGSISCPQCDGHALETDYSAGSAAIVSKSASPAPAACPHAAQCGCGCARGHAH